MLLWGWYVFGKLLVSKIHSGLPWFVINMGHPRYRVYAALTVGKGTLPMKISFEHL